MSPPMIPHHAAIAVITQLCGSVQSNAPAIMSGISSGSGKPSPQANRRRNVTATPPTNPPWVIQTCIVWKLMASRNNMRREGYRDGPRLSADGCRARLDVVHRLLEASRARELVEKLFERDVVQHRVGRVGQALVDEMNGD